MTAKSKVGKVHSLIDFPDGVEAVVRYSGDPDEFTALAHAWIVARYGNTRTSYRDYDSPIGVAPPEPRLFRINPVQCDEYSWILAEVNAPGRGVWLGSYLRTVPIGCSLCHGVGGRHDVDCLNGGVTGLITLQFNGDRREHGLFATQEIIHAVRFRGAISGVRLGGTPGPTLCGMDRFAPRSPSWSVGGGVTAKDVTYRGCYMCGKVARREFPGLTITGTMPFAEAFASDCRMPLAGHLVAKKLAQVTGHMAAV